MVLGSLKGQKQRQKRRGQPVSRRGGSGRGFRVARKKGKRKKVPKRYNRAELKGRVNRPIKEKPEVVPKRKKRAARQKNSRRVAKKVVRRKETVGETHGGGRGVKGKENVREGNEANTVKR